MNFSIARQFPVTAYLTGVRIRLVGSVQIWTRMDRFRILTK